MTPQARSLWAAVALFIGGQLGSVSAAHAQQAAQTPVFGLDKIPRETYVSWSLFLVCDSAWLGQPRALTDLVEAYRDFGATTGRRHAAVWFQDEIESGTSARPEKDLGRNVAYCQKFGLMPREGPHVIFTTIYPDDWKMGDARIVLAFAGRRPGDIRDQLSKLNAQIVTQHLSQAELDSEAWWNRWADAIASACEWLAGVKWSVGGSIRGVEAKIERTGVCMAKP